MPDDAEPTAADDFAIADWEWLHAKQAAKWLRPGRDVIPAWVADMDFPVCSVVRDAIEATLDRGDLGYPAWDQHPLAESFAARMTTRFGWAPNPAHVRWLTDVIQGVYRIAELTTSPGDAITTVMPNYPPFLRAIPVMGRRLSTFPIEHDGRDWVFDADRLSDELDGAGSKLLLFVNPHNPTGHVFRRAELEAIATIACEKDLTVVSDEIHADLTYDPHVHTPLASLDDEIAGRTVTLTSATKSFNIAGLRCAVAHVGSAPVRDAWDARPGELFGTTNVLGVEATRAAWRDGEPWLAALRAHLSSQRDYLAARMGDLPGVSWIAPDATYLAWLDCRAAALPTSPAAFFREKAGVQLIAGSDFGEVAEGFARLNFATSRTVLETIIDQMAAALGEHRSR
jgi:putative C-S lyase